MATGALPTIANTSNPLSTLVDLGNLISLYGGTSRTQTTTSNMSQEGVDATVKRILESEQGLGAATSGANRSGLYNSSTAQLLTDDLVARTAAETERLRAGTTTTVEQPGLGLGSLVGTLAAAKSIPVVSGALNAGIDKLGEALGLTSGTAAGSAAGLASIGGLTAGTAGAAAATGALAGGGLAAGTIPAGLALGAGVGAGGAAAGLGGAAALGAESTAAAGLGGLGGAGALGALGPVGLGLGALALTGILGDVSVICTVLSRKGLVSKELLTAGHKRLEKLPFETRAGYYKWGVPAAERLNKLPVSSKKVKLTAYLVSKYLNYCAGNWNPIGAAMSYLGEPICWLVGTCTKADTASLGKNAF